MKVKSEKQRIRPTGETSIKKTTHRGCLMGELEIPQSKNKKKFKKIKKISKK